MEDILQKKNYQNLKGIPSDSAIPLLSIYPTSILTNKKNDMCTRILTTVSNSKRLEQSKFPLIKD